ncbi:MAG: phosphate regulon sensor histidine kinase PhoR [Pseudomonadota bacterium]|nr:phosphate regulon sensor histidine kinase PhoR [Pseudomonadota bacterium]
MRESWAREIWVLIGILVVFSGLGLAAGHPFDALLLGLAVYLALTLRHLFLLHRWLQSRRRDDIPEAAGLWGDVFDSIRLLMKETERREDQLTQTLTRFQGTSAATPDAMVVMAHNNVIEWANPAAERLLGVTSARDHGLRITNLLRDPDFAGYLESGDFTDAITIPSPERPEKTLSIQIIPFGSSQKLLIGRDITHLERLEAMRRDFVANISHELRTPLTVISGFLETLQDMEKPDFDEIRQYLAMMHEQAIRMQHLVNDLLTLSRLETEPPLLHQSTVDVPAMLAGLSQTARMLSGPRHHDIVLDVEPDLRLEGNEDELRSAFSNLINNAVRYTPADRSVILKWADSAEGARFSVIDTGDGIAPQHLPHLTERFYRVDSARSRATGGTGLGLSIVKHVLLRHDARLGIESVLGQGSTFVCQFPRLRTRRIVDTDSAQLPHHLPDTRP